MPTIPGLSNVPQEPYDRVFATFEGATLAEKAAAHRQFLIGVYTERVTRHEQQVAANQVAADTQNMLNGAT